MCSTRTQSVWNYLEMHPTPCHCINTNFQHFLSSNAHTHIRKHIHTSHCLFYLSSFSINNNFERCYCLEILLEHYVCFTIEYWLYSSLLVLFTRLNLYQKCGVCVCMCVLFINNNWNGNCSQCRSQFCWLIPFFHYSVRTSIEVCDNNLFIVMHLMLIVVSWRLNWGV